MSFCNNNIIDVASDRGSIYLGVWDTLNVRQQQFDVSAWLDAYGDDGVLTVLNQRRTDALPYEVADVTLENGVATWTFDETDTAVVGEGKAALIYIREGETIARTVPFATYTAPTIGMSGSEPPDPWESWYTRVLEASAAAQQAATSAAASATSASTDAETARIRAEQAALARSQAIEARNEARSARDEAQAARGEAVTAAGTATGAAETATTAAGTATGAAETATTAAGGAVIAQGKAEDAQRAAETAQGKAEDAQTAAEAAAAQAEANKYAAFATDGATGVLGFKTTLGSDGIPVKVATVTQTSGMPTTWTLRRIGKNLFDKVNVVCENGLFLGSDGSETHGSANYSATVSYIPIVPGARIVASGLADALGGSTCTVSLYDAAKNFIERKTGWGSGKDPFFTAPSNARYMRFNVANGMVPVGTTRINQSLNVQFEIVDDPAATAAAATAYAAYEKTDYAVTVTALDAPTSPTETPTTLLGDNVFLLLGQADAATMDITARLDPTLIYNSLKG